MFALSRPLSAVVALPWLAVMATAMPVVDTGLELTVEASVGRDAEGVTRGSLHGLGLWSAEWAQPTSDEQRITFAAYASLLLLEGRGPTERFLGDFLAASNIEGHSSARLYTWWIEARHLAWSLRGGALLADEEFAGTEAGGHLLNSAFGWPAFVSANTVNTGPAFFVAAPGLRLEHTWNQTASWRVGIYDGDSFDSPDGDPEKTRHGVHYRLGGNQGWFVISEITFNPVQAQTRLALGAWLHTASFADVREDAAGQPFSLSGESPRIHSDNHGIYALVEHTLFGAAGEPGHVSAFARAGTSPADRNALGWALDAGLAWTGPLPGRNDDVLALGFARADFSTRYANGLRDAGETDAPGFEQALELTYTAALSPRFSVQPDIQRIYHPEGRTTRDDAWLFQLRINASY
ncbi:MAG TPA: carbohydrate porin [Opitutaceae bacterium]